MDKSNSIMIARNLFGDTWQSENFLVLAENGDYNILHNHYEWRGDETPSSSDVKVIDTQSAFEFLKGWHDEYGYRRSPEILNSEEALHVEQGYVMDLSVKLCDSGLVDAYFDTDTLGDGLGPVYDTTTGMDVRTARVLQIVDDIYHGNASTYSDFLKELESEDKVLDDDKQVLKDLVSELTEYAEYSKPRIDAEKAVERSNQSFKTKLFALRDSMDAKAKTEEPTVNRSIVD